MKALSARGWVCVEIQADEPTTAIDTLRKMYPTAAKALDAYRAKHAAENEKVRRGRVTLITDAEPVNLEVS